MLLCVCNLVSNPLLSPQIQTTSNLLLLTILYRLRKKFLCFARTFAVVKMFTLFAGKGKKAKKVIHLHARMIGIVLLALMIGKPDAHDARAENFIHSQIKRFTITSLEKPPLDYIR